jgi:alkylmercury lyase
MGTPAPPLEEYWSTVSKAIRDFPPEQQRVAVTVYRELAKGKPVSGEQLAGPLGVSAETVPGILSREPLRAFVFPDKQGLVVGFGGLAAAPMHHEFRVKGQQLWTWCAWDSLFIPKVLGEAVEVASRDPETGEVVRLTISPTGIEKVKPKDVVVSFLLPDADDFEQSAASVMARFCHYVFFFASRESGERWTIKHKGTFLYSVEDAFELGQRFVIKQFGRGLPRQPAA